jgi:hypothetical protein
MNEDLCLFDEFSAVGELFDKTHAEYIRRSSTETTESNDYPTRELLEILRTEGDKSRVYLLDNGPTGNMPGVYRLDESGEINPRRFYAPLTESTGRSRRPRQDPIPL